MAGTVRVKGRQVQSVGLMTTACALARVGANLSASDYDSDAMPESRGTPTVSGAEYMAAAAQGVPLPPERLPTVGATVTRRQDGRIAVVSNCQLDARTYAALRGPRPQHLLVARLRKHTTSDGSNRTSALAGSYSAGYNGNPTTVAIDRLTKDAKAASIIQTSNDEREGLPNVQVQVDDVSAVPGGSRFGALDFRNPKDVAVTPEEEINIGLRFANFAHTAIVTNDSHNNHYATLVADAGIAGHDGKTLGNEKGPFNIRAHTLQLTPEAA